MARRDRTFGPKLIFVFDNYVLDTGRRELRRGHTVVSVQPQVFDLLEYLIRNRGHVVSRDDLLDAIWGGRIVSESTLATRINAARSAIGDDGESQRLIRTVPRKGIRFVGEVGGRGGGATADAARGRLAIGCRRDCRAKGRGRAPPLDRRLLRLRRTAGSCDATRSGGILHRNWRVPRLLLPGGRPMGRLSGAICRRRRNHSLLLSSGSRR